MSRLQESAPLLQYPTAASHFQPPPQRSDWSASLVRQPYQALHIQHRNALLQQRQQQQRHDEQQHYTFAPHEAMLLYDHEDEEAEAEYGDGEEEEEAEEEGRRDGRRRDSLRLQRVEHSTQPSANGVNSVSGSGSGGRQLTEHSKRNDGRSAVVAVIGAVGLAGAANGRGSGGSETSQSTAAASHHASYGSTSQGTRGESQSQPQSPIVSASRSGSGYRSSAQPQPLHQPADTTGRDGLTDIKDLGYTPASSPVPSLLLSVSSQHVRLGLYLLLSVLIAAANAITWKKTLNKFRAVDGSSSNLEFFVTEWTILLYVVLAAAVLAYRWLFTALITDEQKAYPQRKFALMGLMDAIAGLCSSLGGAFTSGQTQVILNQANIPVTMLLSRSFLSSSYTSTQYIGAALIVAGSLLAAVPSTGSSDGSGGGSSTLWYGPLILLLSCLPNSFSNVYKEKNFREDGLDVYFLTTGVSVWQVLLGFLFAPLLSLPALGGLSLSELPANFSQGWSCFVGGHVPGYECHLSPPPYVVLLLYVLVNFVYNVLLLLITKHGSALLLVIASAISLPFTNAAFTSELLMGREAERWSWWTGAGLLVVVVGFLLYSLVSDADSGDWLPAQGAAGQMLYVVQEPVELHSAFHRARRHSFDVTDSPLVLAHAEERKRVAKQRYLQQRKSSRAAAEVTGDDAGVSPVNDRLFFTPP